MNPPFQYPYDAMARIIKELQGIHDDIQEILEEEKMYPRTNYEMTEEDLKEIIDACKPTPVMFLSGGIPVGGSQQDNANRAWRRLGDKMGFDYMTVHPINGKGQRFFTAIPSENDAQRKERLEREAEEFRLQEIKRLEGEILERQETVKKLREREEKCDTTTSTNTSTCPSPSSSKAGQ